MGITYRTTAVTDDQAPRVRARAARPHPHPAALIDPHAFTLLAVTLALVLAACAPLPPAGSGAPGAAWQPRIPSARSGSTARWRIACWRSIPDNVSAEDVRDTLSKVPAPRVILLHGGVFPVHLAMTSFAQFLIGMGYPAEQIRHPADGSWSHSPYERSERVAGMIAWAYERDGMRPMMVGHSQGGMQVVKVLHDLAGTFAPELPVWDPVSDTAQPRTTIVDPLTRKERPVVGVQASYASAVGAGGPVRGAAEPVGGDRPAARRSRTPSCSSTATSSASTGSRCRSPTSASTRFRSASGKVQVRNVILPAGYLHVTIPVTHHLPDNAEFKRFIDAYRATSEKPDESMMPGTYTDNIYYAADNWAAIKKHWVPEAQRLVRARRARAG